eukprot:2540667-Pyramimonas_sp.AAC.1
MKFKPAVPRRKVAEVWGRACSASNGTQRKALLGPHPLFSWSQRLETGAGGPPGILDLALGGNRPSAVALL